MDIGALRARHAELAAEMERLAAVPDGEDAAVWDMSEEDATRFDAASTEATELRAKIAKHEERQQAIADAANVPGGRIDATPRSVPNVNTLGDAYDLDTVRFDASLADLRARATTGLEGDTVTPNEVKEAAMRTLANVEGDKRSVAMRYLATGNEAYRSAFAKGVQGRMWSLTEAEQAALTRAQSLTDAAGGFAVPFTLDPTIIMTNASAINPFRNIARVVQTTTDSWNGVTGGAASASWDAEGVQVSDDSITLAQPSIPVHKMNVFIPFSVEIDGDWASIDSDLRTAMMEGRDELEATAHAKGTGSGQPTGIEVELDGTPSEIAPATAETFAAADVYELQRVLPARHRQAGPTWVMNVGTAGAIRQFDTSGGGNFWADLGQGTPSTLLEWPWAEASAVDDSPDIDGTATADNFILYVGDWSRYVIVDRVGMSIELIPHLFGTANNRPTGQRGLFGWLRTGAESVDDNAFRVLSIPTTA